MHEFVRQENNIERERGLHKYFGNTRLRQRRNETTALADVEHRMDLEDTQESKPQCESEAEYSTGLGR